MAAPLIREVSMKKILIAPLILLFANVASATQCNRPIEKIFTGYTTSTSKIHVEHGDGYAASVVRLPFVNNDEKIVDRILSVLLTAHMAGRQVTFRYAEDLNGGSGSCTPSVNQIVEAVWIN